MDSMDSYGSGRNSNGKVFSKDGKLYIKVNYWHEEPCKCHPETCCHFNGRVTVSDEKMTEVTGEVNDGDIIYIARFKGYNGVINIPEDGHVTHKYIGPSIQ